MRSNKIAAAAALLSAAFFLTACMGVTACMGSGGMQHNTARPVTTSRPTNGPENTARTSDVPAGTADGGSPAPGGTAESTSGPGSTDPAGEGGTELATAGPGTGTDPANTAAGTGAPADAHIDGFTEGMVIDPADVPLIGEVLGKEFPEHSVQSAVHELYHGFETYRLVLQGKGDLSRTVYMLADGSLLIPHAAD